MASLVKPALNLFQGHLFHPGSQSGTLVPKVILFSFYRSES